MIIKIPVSGTNEPRNKFIISAYAEDMEIVGGKDPEKIKRGAQAMVQLLQQETSMAFMLEFKAALNNYLEGMYKEELKEFKVGDAP